PDPPSNPKVKPKIEMIVFPQNGTPRVAVADKASGSAHSYFQDGQFSFRAQLTRWNSLSIDYLGIPVDWKIPKGSHMDVVIRAHAEMSRISTTKQLETLTADIFQFEQKRIADKIQEKQVAHRDEKDPNKKNELDRDIKRLKDELDPWDRECRQVHEFDEKLRA